jgi:tRNA pseudouridine55 synthase
MLTEKAYDATIELGVATTTDDAAGEPTATADPAALRAVSDDAVRTALRAFVGDLDQVPTAVSAIKVDGKRAYARVRDGEQVELAARRVTVHELTPTRVALPEVDVSLRCSSGTYVRAIARDLGAALGVGGHLTALRRTAVGAFGLDVARTLDELAATAEAGGSLVVPLETAARTSFPAVDLDETAAADVRVGRPLDLELPPDGPPTAVFAPDGTFLALYARRDERARPLAVFV